MKYLWLRKWYVQLFEFMITTNNGNQGPSWWNKFETFSVATCKTSLISGSSKTCQSGNALAINIWAKIFIFFELTPSGCL